MSKNAKDNLPHIRAQAPFTYNKPLGLKICGVNRKIGGPNPIIDIRGWGYLTGGGHGALGLSVEQAKAEQDALGDLVADLLNKHFEDKVLEAEMLQESCHDAPCDEQPMEPIPIKEAQRIAELYGYDQVMIYARKVGDDGREHMTTYGVNKAHCSAAAKIGNFLKFKIMGWTQETKN
jgi:hypothetical protein